MAGCRVSDTPVELDSHRGMAEQKATGLRRLLADAEAGTAALRERQLETERQLLGIPALSWPEAAAKARYVLNLYLSLLERQDSQHRDLIAAVLADFERLTTEHDGAT
jgi:hypothetical protein